LLVDLNGRKSQNGVMRYLNVFSVLFFLSGCCATQMVNLSSNSKWHDVFANQSGEPLTLELTKMTSRKCYHTAHDSTKLRLISIKMEDGNMNAQLQNPGGDGITITGMLDFTLDGSTKVIVIPTGIKLIATSSQKCSIIKIKKGYRFIRKLKN
jgi:hypothetical protein